MKHTPHDNYEQHTHSKIGFFSRKLSALNDSQSGTEWFSWIALYSTQQFSYLRFQRFLFSDCCALCEKFKCLRVWVFGIRCLAQHCRNLSEYSNSGNINEMEAVEYSCFWFCLSFVMWVNFSVFLFEWTCFW